MKQEELRQALLSSLFPLVGGEANIVRKEFRQGILYITLKDQSLADMEALRALSGVTGAELTRGRLRLTLTETYFEEEHTMADNKKIAQDILEAVGGKENVTAATHCMTRLRLNLKDMTLLNDETIKHIDGVLGAQKVGSQYQVIIGQNVPKVYNEFCNLTGLAAQEAINENLNGSKEKLTLKKIGSNIMDYLSGSMAILIPGMMGVGFFKAVQAVFGPGMLGMITEESNFYLLCDIMYNAFFYFLPIFLGWSAAKKLGYSPVLGMMSGAMLLVPTYTALIGTDASFSVYGIPAPVADYGQSIIPVLLSVWVLSYLDKFLQKIIPNAVSAVFVPFFSMVIIAPLNFCLFAPIGARLGDLLGGALIAFGQIGGVFAMALIGALWMFLIMTGMHHVLLMFAIGSFMSTGFDAFIFPAGSCSTWAAFGMALGAFLRLKNKNEKAVALSSFASGVLGGISEPSLYGIGMKYKKPLIPMVIGGFAGGLYAGITHIIAYPGGGPGLLQFMMYLPGGTANFVNSILSCVIALVISAIGTYLFGFRKSDLAG